MSRSKSVGELFVGRHFSQEVVMLCVRWYLRFKLRLCDLVEVMSERVYPWLTQPSCVGCSATCPSSRSGGDGSSCCLT